MIDVISAVLLLAGGLIGLAGAIGLVRFPDVMSRVQAATKPQTLGLLLILVAAALRLDPKAAAGLGLVALFQVITAPVLAQLIGRTAYRTGQVTGLSRDDLGQASGGWHGVGGRGTGADDTDARGTDEPDA